MIVSCPSCGTRYRHDDNPEGRAARCSRCDEVFAFPAQLRSYRVLSAATPMGAVAAQGGNPGRAELAGVAAAPLPPAAAAARTGTSIAMDAPALAPRLARTRAGASSGDGPAGWRPTHEMMPREEEEAGVEPESEQHPESEPAYDREVWETRESPLAHRVLGVLALLALLWSLGGEGPAVGAFAIIAVVTLAWRGWTWASRRP